MLAPSPVLQVSVASLMGHIAAAIVQLDPSQSAEAAVDVDTSGLGGSLSAAMAGVISYLATALQSLNPAVKLEAGRVLLRISSASESWKAAVLWNSLEARAGFISSG